MKNIVTMLKALKNVEREDIHMKRLKTVDEVVANINNEFGLGTIDHTYVSDLFKSKPQDELHKRIKALYLHKTRHTRKKSSKVPGNKVFQYIEQNYIGFKRLLDKGGI